MEKIIERAIRDFDWSAYDAQQLAMWDSERWPAVLAEQITRALLSTHLRQP